MNLLEINRVRNEKLRQNSAYDPVKGVGCFGERVEIATPLPGLSTAFVPQTMLDDPQYITVRNSPGEWQRLRCRHDFEYWCISAVKIKDKNSGQYVPFNLNAPQRRIVAIMEADRLAQKPIRLIILKARQWGGSTLVQMYMAWIQSCHRRNWNSVICAQVKDTAATIRGMYTHMLEQYPPHLWEGDCAPAFKPFERSINVREIRGRGCRVTIASSENQDAVRGGDYAMAHLSEAAFWASSSQRSPVEIIKSICGCIALQPLTLIAMESTANGVGNYFHNEWLRCSSGKGDKHAIFVPWHEIEYYRTSVPDDKVHELWQSLSDYERQLWHQGLTLEMIAWYHAKAAEYQTLDQMHAEYPTTPEEAFINTGSGVFSIPAIEKLRQDCTPPVAIGEIDATQTTSGPWHTNFVPDKLGKLQLWQHPSPGHSYIVTVDIGGRSLSSDWSVIAVFKRDLEFNNFYKRRPPEKGSEESHPVEIPEVVAQWRGHIDHDLLAENAINIARHYNNALLVVESNTLESQTTCGCPDSFILDRLGRNYPNTYCRGSGPAGKRVGFHTNISTKGMIITNLIREVREGSYIERSQLMCNELTTYELTPRGSYAAKEGYHDDILITRAIALHIIRTTRRALRLPNISTPRARW